MVSVTSFGCGRDSKKDCCDNAKTTFRRCTKGKMMDTDEYEISLAREINVCKGVIKQTQAKLAERRERFGMDLPQASQAAGEGRLSIDKKELALWSDDIEALPQWEQRLVQYREALTFMRVSASED